eukprot:gb/GFBE01072609.1/.p1 GENE.gb/GFBE01072609.1/~~gb/GFBE01072609.1/.p1  ORF type:complete len:127 (+),score=16.81 gb/GFBE01072609.1/:1-381(+)
MPDWRLGKKDCGANVNADWTCRPCGRFNLAQDRFCTQCKKENPNWVDVAAAPVDGRSGRLGGHFDRPDPDEPKKDWNSDDEDIDEFGRKKRKGVMSAADKQKAALERLKNKAAARRGGGRSRSRSR